MIRIVRGIFPEVNDWFNALRAGEITAQAALLYAFRPHYAPLNPNRVVPITHAGHARHRIEATFNTEKNHRIGLEHAFCADSTAAQNYCSMLQVARILWAPSCHGYLKRVYD